MGKPRTLNLSVVIGLFGPSMSATITALSISSASLVHSGSIFAQCPHVSLLNLTNHTPEVCPVAACV